MAYTLGECTYGAWLLASWLPTNMGNAATWVQDASRNGLSISQTPIVGSAMVFSGSYPGSEGDGHVGIVQAIGANGFPIIKEMNAGRDGGGFNVYDTYQTTAYDLKYLEGYIVPPSNTSASTTTSAQLTSASSGGFNPLSLFGGLNIPFTPGYDPLLPPFTFNPANAVSNASGSSSGLGSTPIVGPVLVFVAKCGELLIGVMVLMVGFYFIAKESGAPGVTNIIDKVPGISNVAGLVK